MESRRRHQFPLHAQRICATKPFQKISSTAANVRAAGYSSINTDGFWYPMPQPEVLARRSVHQRPSTGRKVASRTVARATWPYHIPVEVNRRGREVPCAQAAMPNPRAHFPLPPSLNVPPPTPSSLPHDGTRLRIDPQPLFRRPRPRLQTGQRARARSPDRGSDHPSRGRPASCMEFDGIRSSSQIGYPGPRGALSECPISHRGACDKGQYPSTRA